MKILCITNQALCKGDYLQQLQKIAAAKPDAMILREKQLSETAYQALAEQVQRICQGQGVQLICNYQISVAEHLSLPVQVSVSQLEQASAWSVPFGVSVHKLEEAKQAEQVGASWVIAGHLFATACKPGLPPRGLSFLQEIKQAVSIPVYGIGGIHVQNAAQVQAIGADGICMMADWMQAEEPEQLMQQLRAIKPEEQR